MIATALHPEPMLRRNDDRPARPAAERTRRPVLVAGEAVDAISVPAAFGALVQAELEIMMLAGPVVADDGSWTFLTLPANSEQPTVPADLLPLGVRLVPSGTRVPVPADMVSRPPAIWSTVVGAARRVAYWRSR